MGVVVPFEKACLPRLAGKSLGFWVHFEKWCGNGVKSVDKSMIVAVANQSENVFIGYYHWVHSNAALSLMEQIQINDRK